MPAKWPLFIKNFSSKIETRDAKSTSDFAKFFAKEYMNAVDTAQTPFGNLHKKSGQKVILEKGFDLSFKMLMASMPPDFAGDLELSKKETDERYADLVEPLPEGDVSYDPYCELEKWTLENSSKLKKFNFYSFFSSTCPVPEDPTELNADFNFKFVRDVSDEFNKETKNHIALFYLINFDPNQTYKIEYELNGVLQPIITPDGKGRFSVNVPREPGKYSFNFLKILDGTGNKVLKTVNKNRSITISEGNIISQLDSIDSNMGLDIEQPETLERENRMYVPEMTESEKIDFIAQRVGFQNDKSKLFEAWVKRLSVGYYGDFGKLVINRFESKYKNYSPSDNVLNEYMFQEEHKDQPDNIPDWLDSKIICKFTYVRGIDSIPTLPVEQYAILKTSRFEILRINQKVKLYKDEKKEFRDLQRAWVKSLEEEFKKEQEPEDSKDPYDIMAGAIIAYWISTLAQPFKKSPPVIPCNIPSPGIFIPLYYGSRSMLAKDLRRSFNMGKIFNFLPATPIASKLVAAAVAVSCAKHLALLKFIYVGQLSTPVGPIPMVGFVPIVF